MSNSRIDRLGDRLKAGPIAEDDLQELSAYREAFADAYRRVISIVRDELGYLPTGRPAKSTTAIVEKLRRESIRLSQVQDIAGVRLVVPSVADQDQLVTRIAAAFDGATIVDRRDRPSNGYRAVHIVVVVEDHPVETQVRTSLQHKWAELSEKLADTVDPMIKYGGGPEFIRSYLTRVSRLIVAIEELERKSSALKQSVEGRTDLEVQSQMEIDEGVRTAAGLRDGLQAELDRFMRDLGDEGGHS